MNIAIFGATSAIAIETARRFAERKANLWLYARDEEKLSQLASDFATRGAASVETVVVDFNELERHAALVQGLQDIEGGCDLALLAWGTLGDQARNEKDSASAYHEIQTNFLSYISLISELANYFEERKAGSLVVISSVAGDRGRKSNYIYGAAKGGVSIFLQGVRNRLYRSGIQVMTVKPGFVDTPMTAEFDKGPLWASPEAISRGILKGIDNKKDIIYLPWFWRFIMRVIKLIPERIFKRLSL